MREITGDLWDYYAKPRTVILITNKWDGSQGWACGYGPIRFANIAKNLGELIEQYGNIVQELRARLWVFPVKHSWEMDADLDLIKKSATQLRKVAQSKWGIGMTFILPRPGCGNGRLKWEDVKEVIGPILPDNVWVTDKK